MSFMDTKPTSRTGNSRDAVDSVGTSEVRQLAQIAFMVFAVRTTPTSCQRIPSIFDPSVHLFREKKHAYLIHAKLTFISFFA